MASKVIEVVSWPASKALAQDPSSIKPTLELLAERKGLGEIFSGLQIEQPNAYVILVWESLDDSHAFRGDEAAATSFWKALEDFSANGAVGEENAYQVSLPAESALKCLRAPVIEHVRMIPKEGVTVEQTWAAMQRAVDWANKPSGAAVAGAFGIVVGKEDTILSLGGWESVQAHMDAAATDEVREIGGAVMGLSTFEMAHVALKEFQK
ncbi:hypothetical protein BC834DRAFT_967494 [Gloeopeniophorella convolvens]|nr:hypothetical protein BC834DRAFT_967494 [Gloeopeniophorella convolvens]